jgi:hypothetical protein
LYVLPESGTEVEPNVIDPEVTVLEATGAAQDEVAFDKTA